MYKQKVKRKESDREKRREKEWSLEERWGRKADRETRKISF